MNINQACINILDQLASLVTQIKEPDFYKPIESLSNSTIGQHLRHTLEFFLCLEQGVNTGLINYDLRAHDKLIETDKFLAHAAIVRIRDFINAQKEDKALTLEVGYDLKSDNFFQISSSYTRELVYNIEHAVHHMALIKIGVREGASYIELPADFGIAASTVRYKESTTASR